MYKLVPVAILAVACGDGGGSFTVDDIESGLVSGFINGAAWEMVEAVVTQDTFDADQLSIEVFAEDVKDCDPFATSTSPSLLFSIDNSTGEYPLNFSFSEGGQTITLVTPPAGNNIATEGIIDLVVNGDSIDVGLVASIDDDNTVNGSFSATVCPSE
ncbi:MAG: hypothetical protein AAF211_17230 [Myxococcota bacterium]